MEGHWTTNWLGRPWIAGTYQCEDFVAEVLREEFGLDVPKDLRGGERDWDRQLAAHAERRWRRADTPQDGDGVLMEFAGALARRFYHVGVYAAGRPPCVLHCPREGTSVLHPVTELAAHGLRLEGVYRWTG